MTSADTSFPRKRESRGGTLLRPKLWTPAFAGVTAKSSIHERGRINVLGVLDDGEWIGRLLDHLAPELAGLRLVCGSVEGALTDRRVKGQAEQRLGDFV